MNEYFCNGCSEYKNSDMDGRHDHCELGYICDECEGLTHEEFHKQQIKYLSKLLAMHGD